MSLEATEVEVVHEFQIQTLLLLLVTCSIEILILLMKKICLERKLIFIVFYLE